MWKNRSRVASGCLLVVLFGVIVGHAIPARLARDEPPSATAPSATAPAANGLFVAVGYGGFRGWSADAQHWTAERWSSKNEDDINIIFSLVYRDGIFLCSGGGVGKGFILRSTDGKHWDEVVRTKWRIAGVTTLPDRFFSIYNDHFQESKDGLKWTELAEAKPVAPDGQGGGYFRRSAVGANGAVVFAGDYALGPGPRIGWIGGTRNGTTPMMIQTEPADVRGLDFGNGRFLACTQKGQVLRSLDGQHFTPTTNIEDEYDDAAITFYQNRFYLHGRQSTRSSTDGEHWAAEPKPPHIPRAISPSGIAVNCGWGGITWSPDGKDWQKASVPIDPTGVCTIVYGVPLDAVRKK